ncbi:glycerophosphodiester phosphodiesterase [Staphylococcus simulans]|uniref:glycerophosphodiester phosphodiesterase n=1 Tax=Staphylococcus simulans TaxID=1286 RepID=UPI000D02D73F|nr:glycerophosphodiester phosphodiesterase family protein [Staphylococcus simulans]MCD8914878.1 glycerophosphodiester phosphodiesterase [Staphylococcus simulans]
MEKVIPSEDLQVIAHRGFSIDYPENTLLAYKAALSAHVDMLEIDVHLTKDQQLVVIHDDKIDRTSNGSGYVKDYTLDELKSYDFGSWKDSTFAGARIMTFKEVAQLVKPYKTTLLIEIKKPSKYPNIEEILLKEIEENRLDADKTIIQSFDDKSIQKIAQLTNKFKLGVLLSKKKYLFRMPNFNKLAKFCDYANPNFELVNKKFVERAHIHKLEVMPYTVNDINDIRKLIIDGVDGIITDGPNYYFDLD